MHVQWPGVNEPAFQFDICNQYMHYTMYYAYYIPYNSINFIAFIMLGIYACIFQVSFNPANRL